MPSREPSKKRQDAATPNPVTANNWQQLRQLTAARIALGRAGMSLPTAPNLAFQLAHARARDAVHAHLDMAALEAKLREAGHETLVLSSAAPDRTTYLQRPDLGRTLSAESRGVLERRSAGGTKARSRRAPRYDATFVIADGLSALAVERNAAGLLAALVAKLGGDWKLAPVALVFQARVAIGDEIGERLAASQVIVLIGERPGLSAPDSLGAYLTFAPKVGRTDAERNCISNIREGGQSHVAAAATLHYLMSEARRRKLSGVGLKDETETPAVSSARGRNFLTDPRENS